MKIKTWFLVAVLAVFLVSCGGGKPQVELLSAEYVPSFTTGGVTYTFENQEIVQLKLDFVFDPAIAANLDPSSEDYRSEIYKILVPGAHLYDDGQEVPAQFGYWPEKAGKNYANELTLFFLLPKGHDPAKVSFVYDGEALGEGGEGLDTSLEIKP